MIGATRFGLRSAVGRLREERLLRVIPRGLTLVAPTDLEEVRDAYEVRTLLEAYAAPLATRLATEADRTEFQQLLLEAREASARHELQSGVEIPRRFYARLAE